MKLEQLVHGSRPALAELCFVEPAEESQQIDDCRVPDQIERVIGAECGLPEDLVTHVKRRTIRHRETIL